MCMQIFCPRKNVFCARYVELPILRHGQKLEYYVTPPLSILFPHTLIHITITNK